MVFSSMARELTRRLLVRHADSPASTCVESMAPMRTPVRTAFLIMIRPPTPAGSGTPNGTVGSLISSRNGTTSARILEGALMTLVGWIVFGLITGFVASRVVNQQGQGCILNIVLGIVGACVGGLIFTSIGGRGI